MKELVFILSQILVIMTYGQGTDTISMDIFYVINGDTTSTYSEDGLPSDCDFAKYSRYQVIFPQRVFAKSNSSKADTFFISETLITGQFENGRKSGIWFYYNDFNYPNENNFGSKNGYGIMYEPDRVTLFDDNKRSNYSISFINDSTTIKGFVVNEMISKPIYFECNEQNNCDFWLKGTRQEVILNGYVSEFTDLFYIAQNGYLQNGNMVIKKETTPNKK